MVFSLVACKRDHATKSKALRWFLSGTGNVRLLESNAKPQPLFPSSV